ncbi:MAG: S41 family peptidase [Bacteroidales bacterium]|nr:S41 family peptidase [Bacteroidales bacterium]
MKANKLFLTLLTALCLPAAFTSCEKLFVEPDPEGTPTQSFEYLWHQVDEKYAFFDIKNVDWQQVYNTYRPMVSDDINDDSLFNVMASMLSLLDDGHTNLTTPFDRSYSDSVYRKMYRRKNVDDRVVWLNYLHLADDRMHTTGGFHHHALRGGKIGYWVYGSFTSQVDSATLTHLTRRYADADGLVIDMRQNGGGAVAYLKEMLKLLPNHGQPLYLTQIKSGPGHDEFTTIQEFCAPKKSSSYCYRKPIVILTDRGSYSATSFFALCCLEYDNVTLVGDTTGGGLGLPNGGQLPNGWTYRFSISRNLTLDGKNYENGVPPDHVVMLDPAATAAGKDNVIEYACDLIESQASLAAASRK